MIYVMSDIHGCIEELKTNMQYINLENNNRIVFLGDYIDYGKNSYQVLCFIYDLQKHYGSEKVIVLKGNHETMFIDWIDQFSKEANYPADRIVDYNWFTMDSGYMLNTFKTLISDEKYETFNHFSRKASFNQMNREAVRLILEENRDIINWIRQMPSYYETEQQIFVHAGVNEDAGEEWNKDENNAAFVWKYPASVGSFIKTIVAGHVGTSKLTNNEHFHDVYYDGLSHYYIDGSVYKGGKLLLLAYDEENNLYYQIEANNWILLV